MKRAYLLIASLAAVRVAAASGSECFAIEDADLRSACLGASRGDPAYCFKVADSDARNACLGEAKADRSYCFKIEDEDRRNACLANTPAR